MEGQPHPESASMFVAVICVALLGLLLFGLGLAVSMTRRQRGIGGPLPSSPTDPLYKVVRAHANTAEFAPMLAVLFLYLGSRDPAAWILWTIGLVTLCRFLIVIGLLASESLDKTHPARFIGATGTYVGGLVLSATTALMVL